jgi:hypothetical protein
MHHKGTPVMIMTMGVLLVITVGIWLAFAQPVSAQCGSSASSCKNCHEVQGEMPVNNDGNAWHQSHAFGDFCYICHGGNSQSMDETLAHTGLVPPLSDIKASCQQCHPNDLEARAQVYVKTLGIEIGNGTSQPTAVAPSATAAAAPSTGEKNCPTATTALKVNDPNLVNYIQNYDEIVLGQHPVNWGNVILLAMIAMIVVGGGGFVILNEKLVKVSFVDMKKIDQEYPVDVVEMLPAISRLGSQTRKSLKNLLENPMKTKKMLDWISRDPSKENDKE